MATLVIKTEFEEAVSEINRYHYGVREDFPLDAVRAFGIEVTHPICRMCARFSKCPIRSDNIDKCNFYIAGGTNG